MILYKSESRASATVLLTMIMNSNRVRMISAAISIRYYTGVILRHL